MVFFMLFCTQNIVFSLFHKGDFPPIKIKKFMKRTTVSNLALIDKNKNKTTEADKQTRDLQNELHKRRLERTNNYRKRYYKAVERLQQLRQPEQAQQQTEMWNNRDVDNTVTLLTEIVNTTTVDPQIVTSTLLDNTQREVPASTAKNDDEDSTCVVPKTCAGKTAMEVPCNLSQQVLSPAHCWQIESCGLYCKNCSWRMDLHHQNTQPGGSDSSDGMKLFAEEFQRSEEMRFNPWKVEWKRAEAQHRDTLCDIKALSVAVDQSLRADRMSTVGLMMFNLVVTDLSVHDRYYLAWKIIQASDAGDALLLVQAHNFVLARKRGKNFLTHWGHKAMKSTYPIMPGTHYGRDTENKVFNKIQVDDTPSASAVIASGPKGRIAPARFPGGGQGHSVLALPPVIDANIRASGVDDYVTGGETRLPVQPDGQGGHYADATSLEPVMNEMVRRVHALESTGQVPFDYEFLGRILTKSLKDARGARSKEYREYGNPGRNYNNLGYQNSGGGYNGGGRGRGRGGYQHVRGSGPDEERLDDAKMVPTVRGQKPSRANF